MCVCVCTIIDDLCTHGTKVIDYCVRVGESLGTGLTLKQQMAMATIRNAALSTRGTCPFYLRTDFERIGNHLPRCKERNGQKYHMYQKML